MQYKTVLSSMKTPANIIRHVDEIVTIKIGSHQTSHTDQHTLPHASNICIPSPCGNTTLLNNTC